MRQLIFLMHMAKNFAIITFGFGIILSIFFYILHETYPDILEKYVSPETIGALFLILMILSYRSVLNYTLSHAKSSYMRYVKSYIYTKNLLLILLLRASLILCIGTIGWYICDMFHWNFFGAWYDQFLSPEHCISAILIAATRISSMHHKALQYSKNNIYKYYQTRGRYISTDTKAYVKKRDKGRCRQCRSKKKLEYDHILPYSRGGKNTPDNIQLLCRKCNRSKGAGYS